MARIVPRISLQIPLSPKFNKKHNYLGVISCSNAVYILPLAKLMYAWEGPADRLNTGDIFSCVHAQSRTPFLYAIAFVTHDAVISHLRSQSCQLPSPPESAVVPRATLGSVLAQLQPVEVCMRQLVDLSCHLLHCALLLWRL